MGKHIFIVVSNGSYQAFDPKALAGKTWRDVKAKHQITTITTTKTDESADSLIIRLVSDSYDPCTSGAFLKKQETIAYGCENTHSFSLSQLRKANTLIVSTGDYRLISLLIRAFLDRSDLSENKCLVFFVPRVMQSNNTSVVPIKSNELAQTLSKSKGMISFVAQTPANVKMALEMSTKELKKMFKFPSLTDKTYMFPITMELKRAVGTPSTLENNVAVVIDGDNPDNGSIFSISMGIEPKTTHVFQDSTNITTTPKVYKRI